MLTTKVVKRYELYTNGRFSRVYGMEDPVQLIEGQWYYDLDVFEKAYSKEAIDELKKKAIARSEKKQKGSTKDNDPFLPIGFNISQMKNGFSLKCVGEAVIEIKEEW